MTIPRVNLVNKKLLILYSLTGLLIIILILTWYFKKSLIPEFFIPQPKTYSVIRFDPKIPQEVSKNDILTGEGIPNGFVKLVISPNGETKEEKVNEKGIWLYTLPKTLKEGLYNLSIITNDRFRKIIGIKRYSINIASSPKKTILGLSLNINFNIIPKAYAQVVYNENICSSNLTQSIEYKCNNGQRCWDAYSQDAVTCFWNPKNNESGGNSLCVSDLSCANPATVPCAYEIKQLPYSCEQGKRCFYQYFRNQSTNCEWKKGDLDHVDEFIRCVSDLNCGAQTDAGTSGTGRVGTEEEYQRLVGQGWQEWMFALQHAGVFPAIQNGEVVYYSKDAYKNTFCKDTSSCVTDIAEYTMSDWNKIFDNDKKFFANVLNEAHQRGCYSFDFLDQYFLGFRDLNRAAFIELGPRPECPDGNINEDDTKLNEILQKEATDKAYAQKDPFLNILNGFEPFVGTRSIYNLVTGYELANDEDRMNAILGVLSVVPAVKGASTIGLKAAKEGINATEAVIRGEQIKNLLKVSNEGITQTLTDSAIVRPGAYGGVRARAYSSTGWGDLYNSSANATKYKRASPFLGSKGKVIYQHEYSEFYHRIIPLLQSGKAFVLDTSKSKPYLDAFWNKFGNLIRSKLGNKVKYEDLYQTIENNWVIVIKDEEMYNIAALQGSSIVPYAYAQGRIVAISESALLNGGDDLTGSLYHEFIHVVSSNYRRELRIGKYFDYNQEQTDMYGRFMSMLYEMTTDEIVYIYTGFPSSYAVKYPKIYASMRSLILKLFYKSGNKIQWDDLIKFALTGDDVEFLNTIITKYGEAKKITVDEFLSLIGGNVDRAKLYQVLNDPMWLRREEINRFKNAALVGGGTAITAAALFTASAKGEELPEDITVLYPPLEFAEDIDFSESPTEASQAPTIISITINGETVTPDNLDKTIFINLPGTEGQTRDFNIPIIVNYSDKTNRYMALTFSYQPNQSFSQSVSTEVVQNCTPGTYDTKCSGNCGGCNSDAGEQLFRQCNSSGTDWGNWQSQCSTACAGVCTSPATTAVSCPASYPQCGGTTGLEDYPATDTILVTPLCNNNGNISGYRKENLGNKGECQQTTGRCDDQYYFDTTYDTCVHKFSGDSYPNCNYVFDRAERSLCP